MEKLLWLQGVDLCSCLDHRESAPNYCLLPGAKLQCIIQVAVPRSPGAEHYLLSPHANPLISSRALCLAASQVGTEFQLVFFSCGGCGDIPVTQLIHKEKGWRNQLGCRLQMRTLQYAAHWCAARGGHPKAGLHWTQHDMRMRGRPWESSLFSLSSPQEWVQGRLQMGMVKATTTSWGTTGHIPSTSRN